MMFVDLKISPACKSERKAAVLRQLLQHVIEEANAGLDLDGSRGSEIDPNLDSRLGSLPHDVSSTKGRRDGAHAHARSSRSFSSGAPIVIRSASERPGYWLTSRIRSLAPYARASAATGSLKRARTKFASLGSTDLTIGSSASARDTRNRSARTWAMRLGTVRK